MVVRVVVRGGDFLDRFVFPLQASHFSLERALQLVLRAPEFSQTFRQVPAQFG
jgi:hypothetical protein